VAIYLGMVVVTDMATLVMDMATLGMVVVMDMATLDMDTATLGMVVVMDMATLVMTMDTVVVVDTAVEAVSTEMEIAVYMFVNLDHESNG
jgi:hypothetical protein